MRTLSSLKPGESARVRELVSAGSIVRRMQDFGLVENTRVTCVGQSPMGDPKAFLIRGAVIALRNKDIQKILISTWD